MVQCRICDEDVSDKCDTGHSRRQGEFREKCVVEATSEQGDWKYDKKKLRKNGRRKEANRKKGIVTCRQIVGVRSAQHSNLFLCRRCLSEANHPSNQATKTSLKGKVD